MMNKYLKNYIKQNPVFEISLSLVVSIFAPKHPKLKIKVKNSEHYQITLSSFIFHQ